MTELEMLTQLTIEVRSLRTGQAGLADHMAKACSRLEHQAEHLDELRHQVSRGWPASPSLTARLTAVERTCAEAHARARGERAGARVARLGWQAWALVASALLAAASAVVVALLGGCG